jgi:glycosyltransferase involved in cell wall biosynthesis
MSLPSKLTSYFCAGVPVVAAVPANGGTAREVERSGGGVLVPPEDPRRLLAALEALGADPGKKARLGAAGAVHARDHLDREVCLRRLGDVVNRAMAR